LLFAQTDSAAAMLLPCPGRPHQARAVPPRARRKPRAPATECGGPDNHAADTMQHAAAWS